MAKFGTEVKTFLFRGLEAIGDAAASIGTTAKQKLNEMKLENRRDDLRRQIPSLTLQLWKDGAELPEALTTLLSELNDLNEQLNALHAKPEPTASEEKAEESAPSTFEEAMENLEDKVEDAADSVEDWAEKKVEEVKEAIQETFSPTDEPEYEPISVDDPKENE